MKAMRERGAFKKAPAGAAPGGKDADCVSTGRCYPRKADWNRVRTTGWSAKMGFSEKTGALRSTKWETEFFTQQGPDGTEISTFVSKGGWHGLLRRRVQKC